MTEQSGRRPADDVDVRYVPEDRVAVADGTDGVERVAGEDATDVLPDQERTADTPDDLGGVEGEAGAG